MRGLRKVLMTGQIRGLAAPDATGPVYLTSDDGDGSAITAVDLAGTVLWRRSCAGRIDAPKVSAQGTVWVVQHGGAGEALLEFDAAGEQLRAVTPEQDPEEHLGAFVLLPDGFCLAWQPTAPSRVDPPGRAARVAGYEQSGVCRWSTPVALGRLSLPAVAEATPGRWWNPGTTEVAHRDPLLVSGNRIAATFQESSSGIGRTFFLDSGTGELRAASAPGPVARRAIAGQGQFLLGTQGYDAFSTVRCDGDGVPIQEWPSHLQPLVDRHGGIRGPESANVLPSRSRFRGLVPDGSLRDGPPLPGYRTTYPALDEHGTAVFWRAGRLLAVDARHQAHELFAADDDRAVMSRVLLLARGQLAFALDDELLLFADTGLGALDTGVWPCGEGNLRGNPVLP